MNLYLLIISLIIFKKIFTENQLNLDIYKKQLEFCDRLKNPKAKQDCKNNVLLLMAQQTLSSNVKNKDNKNGKLNKNEQTANSKTNSPETHNCSKDNRCNQKDDTSEILTNFASIVANFGKIAVNPYNPLNLHQSISSMLEGIIKIASTMTRKFPKIEKQEIDEIINDLDNETKKSLAQISCDEAIKVYKRHKRSDD